MLKIDIQGAFVRLTYSQEGKEAVAIGPTSDLPTLLGLFVAQMLKENFDIDKVCSALKEAWEEINSKR